MTIQPTPITLADIRAGDEFASRGGRRSSSFSGKVLKANRVTLDIETAYMWGTESKPMFMRIRRDALDGEVRVMRAGLLYSTLAGKAVTP